MILSNPESRAFLPSSLIKGTDIPFSRKIEDARLPQAQALQTWAFWAAFAIPCIWLLFYSSEGFIGVLFATVTCAGSKDAVIDSSCGEGPQATPKGLTVAEPIYNRTSDPKSKKLAHVGLSSKTRCLSHQICPVLSSLILSFLFSYWLLNSSPYIPPSLPQLFKVLHLDCYGNMGILRNLTTLFRLLALCDASTLYLS